MQSPLIPHRIVIALVAAALLLPITICVVFGVGALLAAMGDSVGGAVLGWIALAGGILWAVVLISLVLLQAMGTLRSPGGPKEPLDPEA